MDILIEEINELRMDKIPGFANKVEAKLRDEASMMNEITK